MFDILNNLEIVLITYNRLNFFQHTIKKILSEDSPIKNCQITILDNHSDDGTSELCSEYVSKYSNIKHIRHNINIGGNANIVRGYEIAVKEYVWILCDDDDYNWNHWEDIKKGLEENYDIILTTNQPKPEDKGLHRSIWELTFLPGGIYKTKYFSTDVFQMAAANIVNILPHMAFACDYVNNNRKIYAPENRVISPRIEDNPHANLLRGCNEKPPHRVFKMDLLTAYINTFKMIKDKKLRYECNEYLIPNRSFQFCIQYFLSLNYFCYENFLDIFLGLNFKQRIIYVLNVISYLTKTEDFLKFYKGENRYYIKLFILKTKIWNTKKQIKTIST